MAEKTDAVAVKKPRKAAPKKSAEAVEGTQKITFALTAEGETKSYAVFAPPKDSGCVGKFYAPKGTKVVKILLEGPAA